MNLGVSIANLLRRYPAVEVPGIGVFKKIHDSASYDAGQGVFFPPKDRIELVVEQHAGVFPITTYLQAQQQVDAPTAAAILETAVKEVMNSISRNGEALLDGLGYLLADGASFIFKPFEVGGLAAKPITAPVPVAGETTDTAGITEAVSGATEEAEATEAVATGHTERRYTPWVIAIGAAVLLIAGGAVVWHYQPTWFGGKLQAGLSEAAPASDREAPSNATTPLAGVPEDTAVTDTGQVAAIAVDPAPVGADSASETTALPAKPSVTYEIIVGSFATMRQANKFVTEMKAKGYDLYALESRMPGNRKKISWGSFATEEAAYKELARVQKTFEPGAWIAKIEHE